MPSIEVSSEDMQRLLDSKLTIDELSDLVAYAKCTIDAVNGDTLKLAVKDTNRPDLWSAEGIAREIRFRTRKPGLPRYRFRNSSVRVNVDRSVHRVRPYTVCTSVTDLELDQFSLSQMIQLQEKVAVSFGKNRREIAIGVYDLDKIKAPIKYTTVDPDGIQFVPLDFKEKLTPREILEKHPKGREFGQLLAGADRYPMFIDSAGEVLSIPPIINSDYTGKVTEDTRNVFIECSGFALRTLSTALNVVSTALAERGAVIEKITVQYPNTRIVTPDLSPKTAYLKLQYLNRLSGLQLSMPQACRLLRKSGYDVSHTGQRIRVLYPSYRQDIMHERDLIEDLLISYGYDKIPPVRPKLPTVGKGSEIEDFSNLCSRILIGLGFQETMSYILTNKSNQFEKMNLKEGDAIELENPASSNWNVFRSWLLPCVMEFLSNNLHVEYPQRVFEIGDVVISDESVETRARDLRKMVCALSNSSVSYEEISPILDALFSALGMKYELTPKEHPSFIEGRAAAVRSLGEEIGFIGEINPQVLESWRIEAPVAAFELDVNQMLKSLLTLGKI